MLTDFYVVAVGSLWFLRLLLFLLFSFCLSVLCVSAFLLLFLFFISVGFDVYALFLFACFCDQWLVSFCSYLCCFSVLHLCIVCVISIFCVVFLLCFICFLFVLLLSFCVPCVFLCFCCFVVCFFLVFVFCV